MFLKNYLCREGIKKMLLINEYFFHHCFNLGDELMRREEKIII